MDYPECEKIHAKREESTTIGNFLDWAEEKGYVFCVLDHKYDDYYPITKRIEELLADYFGIDLEKAEKERQQMIEEIRKNQ